jgi:hypothetical protein
MRIRETATDDLVHELRPLEATPRDRIGEPMWLPDGKYLLAPGSGPDMTGIWNAETGRYRGVRVGCIYPEAPWTQILLQGTKFYKTCIEAEILMWNVDKHIHTIAGFEATLPK